MNLLQLAVLPLSFPAAVAVMPIIFTVDALLDATVILVSHRVMPKLYEGVVKFHYPTDLLYEANVAELGVSPLDDEPTQHVQVFACSPQEARHRILDHFLRNNPGLDGKLIRSCSLSQIQ